MLLRRRNVQDPLLALQRESMLEWEAHRKKYGSYIPLLYVDRIEHAATEILPARTAGRRASQLKGTL